MFGARCKALPIVQSTQVQLKREVGGFNSTQAHHEEAPLRRGFFGLRESRSDRVSGAW